MTAGGGMPSTAKPPMPIQAPVPSPAIPQHWTHLLGMNPYHNPVAAAYGPMLQQQAMMSGPGSHFAVPQQHGHMPYGLSMQQQQPGANMLSHGISPAMQSAQAFVPTQPQPTKQAPPVSNTHASKVPETQLTTKHIVVDIAETCLNMFPFGEVAKRHNQTEQKVRDVFDAVIQVPLLRCVTDKRRAGKLGTTRTKEFKDVRKEVQTQVAATQSKQDAAAQGPYMPSAWEMAQFMGPGDVRMGVFSPFSGPW
ncbi:hypothetical protein CPLU01_07936 [Colletotrichum plurivorum]|uniref:Uncharacterized protein n=1 Tax=Colletotrichum plurivorum TaxID=2175906 RepID=A0A8H6KDQ7_9PEZI|nr:hypothetical protein CPLU01_07936 [Colletotrichum plurivorum]